MLTHDARQPISIGHLSHSGDLKMVIGRIFNINEIVKYLKTSTKSDASLFNYEYVTINFILEYNRTHGRLLTRSVSISCVIQENNLATSMLICQLMLKHVV